MPITVAVLLLELISSRGPPLSPKHTHNNVSVVFTNKRSQAKVSTVYFSVDGV